MLAHGLWIYWYSIGGFNYIKCFRETFPQHFQTTFMALKEWAAPYSMTAKHFTWKLGLNHNYVHSKIKLEKRYKLEKTYEME